MGMNPKLGLLVGSISNPRVGGERFVCKQKVTYCKLAPELGSVQKERMVIGRLDTREEASHKCWLST